METRFSSTVLHQPTGLSHRRFEPLFLHYAAILETLRATHARILPRAASASKQAKLQEDSEHTHHNAAIIQAASRARESIDLDTALAVTPLSEQSSMATYWVHEDNLMNLQILLLRHTSNRAAEGIELSDRSRSSTESSLGHGFTHGENYGSIICDDLIRFAKRRSSETVKDVESQTGKVPQNCAVNIRFSSSPNALVAIKSDGDFIKADMSKKSVYKLLTIPNSASESPNGSDHGTQATAWISRNPDTEPLVRISSNRTQFIGLKNSAQSGTWAPLDNDIVMRICSREALASDEDFLEVGNIGFSNGKPFPHAILEVRAEGDESRGLIKMLDQSHLV